MRTLELDFVARPRRSSWQGAMLLLAGAIAVLELFSSHDELLREHASISDEIAQIERHDEMVEQVWNDIEGLGHMFIWQVLVTF